MENAIDTVKNNMLEWWFVFSQTGDIYDCMAWMESLREYDALLNRDYELEM